MITTKLVRSVVVVVVLALVAVSAVEVHWSMNAKNDARRTAARAATSAAHVLFTTHDSPGARAVAEKEAAADHVNLDSFTIRIDGTVHVTVSTRARSYLLRRIGATRSVSEVTVGADAPQQ